MLKKRVPRVAWALSTISALAVLTAPASYAQEKLPVVASAEANGPEFDGSTIEVHWIEQAEDSGFTNVAWSATLADEASIFSLIDTKNRVYEYSGNAASGVTLVDKESETRYHPIQDSAQHCLCTGTFNPPALTQQIEGGESSVFWTSYLLNDETSTVALEVTGFAPVEDIPVE